MPDGDGNLRLALCAAGELFGGVERQLLGLCEYAQRRTGVPPALLLFHDRELARQARRLGVAPTIVPARHRYDPAQAARLAAALTVASADVVHAHGYRAAIACVLARRHWRGAVVKTEHGRIEPSRGRPLVWAKSRLNTWLDTRATRRADAVCYVTDDLRRHWERRHRGLARHVVLNGIDPLEREGRPRPPELEPGPVHLGIVGRVSAVKGIPTALRALADGAVPERVRLSVVGDGPLLEPLRREAAALGLGGRVRLLGFRENVYDYLAHLDALLMPSLHEGLPYVLLEAMALGTPVFASRVGGLAEVVRDGETGVLLPVGDAAALRAAIVRLADDPAWGRALGAAARREQRERYTLERMGRETWRVYEAAAVRAAARAAAGRADRAG